MRIICPNYSNRDYAMQHTLEMTIILRFWRDKSKAQKQDLKSKYGITIMTYEQIKIIHENEIKKS